MSEISPNTKEAKLQAAKSQYVEEAKFDPTKARYGLFSFTGTLAIGDDSLGRRTKPKRDVDGRVLIAPRNFYTTPPKGGKVPSSFFSSTSYISTGDPYRDPGKVLNSRKPNPRSDDTPAFKPAGSVETSFFAYSHEAVAAAEKKAKRDENGAVVIGPKNFLVPRVKGDGFGRYPATTNDPYERKWQLEREEKLKQNALIRHDRPFRSTSPGGHEFTKPSEAYGKPNLQPTMPRLTHSAVFPTNDSPFKPSNPAKTSILDMTIGRYPEHKPCPEPKSPPPARFDVPWK